MKSMRGKTPNRGGGRGRGRGEVTGIGYIGLGVDRGRGRGRGRPPAPPPPRGPITSLQMLPVIQPVVPPLYPPMIEPIPLNQELNGLIKHYKDLSGYYKTFNLKRPPIVKPFFNPRYSDRYFRLSDAKKRFKHTVDCCDFPDELNVKSVKELKVLVKKNKMELIKFKFLVDDRSFDKLGSRRKPLGPTEAPDPKKSKLFLRSTHVTVGPDGKLMVEEGSLKPKSPPAPETAPSTSTETATVVNVADEREGDEDKDKGSDDEAEDEEEKPNEEEEEDEDDELDLGNDYTNAHLENDDGNLDSGDDMDDDMY